MTLSRLLCLALLATSVVACIPHDGAGAPLSERVPTESAVPVTVDVCGEKTTFTQVPTKVVTHDVNITELFMYLGLGDRLVGTTGIPSDKEVDPRYRSQLAKVPNLSRQSMNLEAIVGAHADFVFGGWIYGFRPGEVTPARLAKHGIASYVLSESCIHVGPRERVSMDDTLNDMRNLATIFRMESNAAPLIQTLERDLRDLQRRMANVAYRPRVFVYDSGESIPMTAGRFGMPQAMIETAGGRNIFDDINSNWPRGNWEDVVARNPEWIIVVDYGVPSARGKIEYLLSKPELSKLDAIRNRRFVIWNYAQATPGPRNIEKSRELAMLLHPLRLTAVEP